MMGKRRSWRLNEKTESLKESKGAAALRPAHNKKMTCRVVIIMTFRDQFSNAWVVEVPVFFGPCTFSFFF